MTDTPGTRDATHLKRRNKRAATRADKNECTSFATKGPLMESKIIPIEKAEEIKTASSFFW